MIILKDAKIPITGLGDIAKLLQDWLKTVDPIDRDKEHFIVIHCNTRLKITQVEVISIGIVNASIVHPRETFRRAVIAGACNIIIGHNHPSGDCEPSNEDIELTKRICEAGKILHIQLLDHIIFSDTSFYSFREAGYL
jgi:DNA repair protein RadC